MALTFQNAAVWEDVNWGLITKAEIRVQGTGSFLDMGEFDGDPDVTLIPITAKSDPSDTDMIKAVRIEVSIRGVQTKLTGELASFAGTSGTGLFDTNVELKLTFAQPTGRTLTLGADTSYPLRLVPHLKPANAQGAQIVEYKGSYVEPYTNNFASKFAA